jgi:hypothetical protein
MIGQTPTSPDDESPSRPPEPPLEDKDQASPKEIGGRDGPDPTRYGDWEKNGRCIDF